MAKVTGLGGVFFKAADKETLRKWYGEALGLDVADYGKAFLWRDDAAPDERGYTVFAPFDADTKYFAPSTSPFMINFRVDDLDGVLARLTAAGSTIVGGPDKEPNGRFAWVLDPEGNKIELWEPVPSKDDPYL
jgi:predicted enzyme related to lactoylglutathione lyase